MTNQVPARGRLSTWLLEGDQQPDALRFLFAGEGGVPPLTHEILRRAVPDAAERPVVHVGG